MIEILQFGLSANRGGIETYLKKIWDNIDHTKFHFNFIDMTREGEIPCFYDELAADGCSFYKVTPRQVSILKNRSDIKSLFENNHFDIFHFNINTLSYLYPVEVALRNGCRVLVHSRNAGSYSNGYLTRVLHELNKKRLQEMDVTRIAVSQMAGEWMFGKSGFAVYNNGVITGNFIFTAENRKAAREEFGCENKTVIANVGAFVPAKNHVFMVNNFEEFFDKHPDSVLWFIGDGPLRPEIESFVEKKHLKDKILFLGVRKDMQKLYAGMDLLWFPSLYEGFGSVLLEAQCEGVPCLLSDCIPQEARILENTFSYSLKEPPSNWALKMQEAVNAQLPDRENCWLEMEERGASVKSEIQRLQTLYQIILSN